MTNCWDIKMSSSGKTPSSAAHLPSSEDREGDQVMSVLRAIKTKINQISPKITPESQFRPLSKHDKED